MICWEVSRGLRSMRYHIDAEEYREKKKELHDEFIDLKKAYDKVCEEELWRVLHERGVHGMK